MQKIPIHILFTTQNFKIKATQITLHKNTLLGRDTMLSLAFKHHALCLLHGQNLAASIDKMKTLMRK